MRGSGNRCMKRRPYPTTAIPLALIALAGLIAASIATRQLLWMIASYVASVCIIGFLIAFALRRRYKPAPGESPISLVLLLSEPRYLDANILSKLAGKAWGVPMLDIPLSENYVRGS